MKDINNSGGGDKKLSFDSYMWFAKSTYFSRLAEAGKQQLLLQYIFKAEQGLVSV